MRKILITAFFIGLLASQSAFCVDDNFKLGKDAFNKKDYASANVYFVRSLTANPNDANCRYYYAQTLTYLKNYKQARKEYGYVVQLAPKTQLADYAKQSISNLDSMMVKPEVKQTLSSDNYIKKAITNQGELVTWNPDNMPIKIYIDNSRRVSNSYVLSVKDALEVWRNSTAGNFNYVLIKEPEYADVKIVFKGMAEKTDNQLLGLTEHNEKNGYISSAVVSLYTLKQDYKPMADYDVYNVALHEFGHMLGISGHSDDEGDIMNTTYNPNKHKERMSLSQRDINTAKALYEIDKNPYATSLNSINRVLGNKETRLNDKLQQSLDYIKSVPDNPIGYVNTGNVYMETGNEVEAINYYKKALAISPNDSSANYHLAQLYHKRDDLVNAEPYCKNIIKNQPKEISAYYILSDLYLRKNKVAQARVTINSLLYRNPAAKNDSQVKEILSRINK